MSQLIGGALPVNIIERKDRRLVPLFQNYRAYRDRISGRDLPTSFPGGFCNDFWPGNRGFVGEATTSLEATWSRQASRLAWGIASRVGFVGRTYDQNGNLLAGVTCSLFRTSDKLWIMDVISGADGSFLLQSFYSPDTHFIVFSKAGAPEVFGTTRQTLVGA
jgi:hypothetical protein